MGNFNINNMVSTFNENYVSFRIWINRKYTNLRYGKKLNICCKILLKWININLYNN